MKKINLRLEREYYNENFTLGRLYVDDVYECDTLEPRWRDYAGGDKKVKGESAIPEGRYKMFMRSNGRHHFTVPQLMDVPMFNAIQIHPGNTFKDTQGCILVGINHKNLRVCDSVATFSKLFYKLEKAVKLGKQMWIEIVQRYDAPLSFMHDLTDDIKTT